MTDPHAMYIYCDGAMDYKPKNPGGIGYHIIFPESTHKDPISFTIGTYERGNIERLEIEALIQAMKEVMDIFKRNGKELRNINQIIFVTDRFGLSESEKTNPYRIKTWRSNNWRTYEGKPIKNHKLLDELDKTRKKLADLSRARVNIEYKPRKQNKVADKLAKKGKTEGLIIDKLAKKGEKIGKRKFEGDEIKYSKLFKGDELLVHVFRKDPVQDEWEVWVEICEGLHLGSKLKIYTDDILSSKLQRRNEYSIKIKEVLSHHIRIFRTIKKNKHST
jgi:ribonuclease HI